MVYKIPPLGGGGGKPYPASGLSSEEIKFWINQVLNNSSSELIKSWINRVLNSSSSELIKFWINQVLNNSSSELIKFWINLYSAAPFVNFVKLNFRPYIRRYTSPNENFEYSYPLIYLRKLTSLLQFGDWAYFSVTQQITTLAPRIPLSILENSLSPPPIWPISIQHS